MWRFEVRTPDGRVFHFDGPQAEHHARGKAIAFNQHIPRGGKLAQVVTLPASFPCSN